MINLLLEFIVMVNELSEFLVSTAKFVSGVGPIELKFAVVMFSHPFGRIVQASTINAFVS